MKIKPFLILPLLTLGACSAPTYIEVSAVEISRNAVTLEVGQNIQLTASVVGVPAGAQAPAIAFWSSDSSIATVDANGLVSAVSSGEASILAISGSKSAVCRVSVPKQEEAVVTYERTGTLKSVFASPYFELNKTFESPVSLHHKTTDSGLVFDLLLPFGDAGDKSVDNFTVVAALAKKQLASTEPVLAAYKQMGDEIAAHPEQGKDIVKGERFHVSALSKDLFYALTNKKATEAETCRYKHVFGSSGILGVLRSMGFFDDPAKAISETDWRNLLNLLLAFGNFPSGTTKADMIKDGAFVSDLIEALAGTFTLAKKGDNGYRLFFDSEGLAKLNKFVAAHYEELKLSEAISLTKFEFMLTFDASTVVGLDSSVAFTSAGGANTIDSTLTIGEEKEAASQTYLDDYAKAVESW